MNQLIENQLHLHKRNRDKSPSRSAKLRAVKRTDTKKTKQILFRKIQISLRNRKDRIQVMKKYLLLVLIIILIISTSWSKHQLEILKLKFLLMK